MIEAKPGRRWEQRIQALLEGLTLGWAGAGSCLCPSCASWRQALALSEHRTLTCTQGCWECRG